MDFNELLIRLGRTLVQRRRLYLSIFMVCFLAATAGAYLKSQWYKSTATIFVSLTSPRLDTTHSEQRNSVATLRSEEFVASQVELMRTRELAEELVNSVPAWVFEQTPSSKWYIRLVSDIVNSVTKNIKLLLVKMLLINPDNPHHKNIQTIESGLDIFPVRKSQVIEVSFSSKNPEAPKVVLDTFINIYKKRLADLRAKSEGATIYLEQTEQLNKELEQAERALTDFMVENGVVDIALEKSQILERLDTLSSLAKSSNASEDEPGNMIFTITGPNAPPQILQQNANLNALLNERVRLAASFTKNQRDVLRLDAQIASIREVLNEELKALAYVIEQDRAELERLLEIEPRYNWLSRQVRLLSTSYETYSKAAKDRQTFFDRDNQILVHIIDAPAVPLFPQKPTRLVLVAIGFALAAVIALIGVLVVEWVLLIRWIYAFHPPSFNDLTTASSSSEADHVSEETARQTETSGKTDIPADGSNLLDRRASFKRNLFEQNGS
ncbi:GumC family protein [Sneathiella litorea]|uniref:Polysaccharide chain length determinant N-terminal domain-containing protein n=1 Tax=Sneathiella litorea TaxID=2606216 RepID=A0A6L8WDE2_9PROT|nr:hypothetical protein [Sneathiella litorea]MZR32393.1 hypothetical protein [Sneathiella litorea]